VVFEGAPRVRIEQLPFYITGLPSHIWNGEPERFSDVFRGPDGTIWRADQHSAYERGKMGQKFFVGGDRNGCFLQKNQDEPLKVSLIVVI